MTLATLPVGFSFTLRHAGKFDGQPCTYVGNSYAKVSDTHVRNITDGRVWTFADCGFKPEMDLSTAVIYGK